MNGKALTIALVLLTAPLAHAEEAKDKDDLLSRFAGSAVGINFSTEAITFDEGQEQTYNPYFGNTISLDPRYRLTKEISVAAHIDVSTELTNSDDTTYERQPLLSDLAFRGSYKLGKLPQDLVLAPSATILLPTSLESIARHRIFGGNVQAALGRDFELTKDITVTPRLTLRASGYVATQASVTYDGPTIPFCANATTGCEQLDHSGVRSSRFALREGLGVDVSLPFNLSASIAVLWIQSNLYGLDEARDPVTGEVIAPGDGPSWRYANSYSLGAEWKAHKHVTVGAGLQTDNPQLAPDSTYYRPFFNRYTQVFVETRVEL